MYIWKRWKKVRTRYVMLKKLGLYYVDAFNLQEPPLAEPLEWWCGRSAAQIMGGLVLISS